MGYLAIFLSAIIGSFNIILLKYIFNDFSPEILLFLRFFLALIMFLPLYMYKNKLDLAQVSKTFLPSFVHAISLLMFFIGLKLSSPNTAQVMLALIPVLVAIGSQVILKERLTQSQIIGFILGFLGVLTIILYLSHGTRTVVGFDSGFLFLLFATFLNATFILSSRKVSALVSPQTMALGNIFVSAVLGFVMVLFSEAGFAALTNISQEITQQSIIILLVLSSVGTVLLFYLYLYGLKHTSAFFGGLVQYFQMPFVFLLGYVFLDEAFSFYYVFGSVLIIVGGLIATNGHKIKFWKVRKS